MPPEDIFATWSKSKEMRTTNARVRVERANGESEWRVGMASGNGERARESLGNGAVRIKERKTRQE